MQARIVLVLLPFFGLVSACGSNALDRNVQMASASGTTKSHFPDQNCMSCHQKNDVVSPNGDTPGFFTLAGTIRTADGTIQPNQVVVLFDKLYDVDAKKAGNELMRLSADALGMFYTTAPVPVLDGPGPHTEEEVFPAILDPSTGTIAHMYKGVSTGSCNVCHQGLSMNMSPTDDVDGDPWHQSP